MTEPAAQRYDLRHHDVRDVTDRVEQMLDVRLDPASVVRKRRTIGAATATGSWVRIELRGSERMAGPVAGQGWGFEAAQALTGVARPQWFRGASWRGEPLRPGTVWRVDEVELIRGAEPIRTKAEWLEEADALPPRWWDDLATSLEALAAADTSRLATPDCQPITTARVEAEIRRVFPVLEDLHPERWQWMTAHADLGWSNVTGPQLWITDWEDWGRAPRGLDAANLWANSLGSASVAAKVEHRFRSDLESETGRIMALWRCAQIVAWGQTYASAYVRARTEATRIVEEL
ncbi:hypothetical protein KGQ19_16875 [Catenulispora sp. NL8]|uniref:Aminoglycoside phosphotransferase n=1 Tax=Catenulispora pinistramenti TaxID=2705254 RepID=A0ABS5KR74_9ACTN|nr:hypothetical protein [Catenulispora pinistramenti]MBS2548543.1 hypothetical protein [Catenulispora pinistramenti]